MLKLFLAFLIVTTSSAGRVHRCQTDYYKTIHVQELSIRPSSFDAGDYVTLYAKFDNQNNTITSGFIHYTIVHDGEEYEPQVDDLCSSIKCQYSDSLKGLQCNDCPINKGRNELELKFKIPLYLEPITLYVELMDYSGHSFICGKINAKLSIWDWISSWVTPKPDQPIMDVRRSLRGIVLTNTTDNETIQTMGPTAGMRPSSSSIIVNA